MYWNISVIFLSPVFKIEPSKGNMCIRAFEEAEECLFLLTLDGPWLGLTVWNIHTQLNYSGASHGPPPFLRSLRILHQYWQLFIDFVCKIQMSAFSTFVAANKITNSLSCCQCFFYSTFFTEGVVLINPKSFDDHLIIIIISSFWPNLQFKTYLTMTSQYFWKHIIKSFSNDDLDVSNTSAITTLKSEAGSKGLASHC